MTSTFLNELLTSVSFGESRWLWALLLLPALLALFFWNEKRRGELLRKLVATRLQSALAASVSAHKRRLRFFSLLAGMACVIVALAQPRWGYVFEISKPKGRDVVIAIDTSKSMLANDLAPSRLTRAKLAAQDLINTLQGDRVGVVAFAGSAFLQAPLTIDYSAVLASINELDTNIIPRGGTDIAAAIRAAADAFGKGESANHALILFTDGEELEESAVKAARDAADKMRIFTVGVGTEKGSLIPVTNEQGGTDFVKDEHGQIVKSRLDESCLKEIAQTTGGFYVRLQNGPEAMKQIVNNGLAPMREKEIDARQSRRPIERYQWPLAAGIFFLAGSMLIGERRRVNATARARGTSLSPTKSESVATASTVAKTTATTAAALFLLGFLIAPTIARCAVNRGVELYDEGRYKEAYDEFQKFLKANPNSDRLQYNAGAAAYKMRDYQKALDAFAHALTTDNPKLKADAEYNFANTLYQEAKNEKDDTKQISLLENAIQHYNSSLKADPQTGDAKSNREAAQKWLDQLKKKSSKPEQNQQQKKNSKNDQQKQNQQNQHQQQNQQSSQNQNEQQKHEQSQQNGQQNQQKNEQKQAQQNQQNQSGKSNEEKNEQAQNSGQQKQQDQQQQQQQQQKQSDSQQNQNENQQQQSQPQNAQAAPQPSPSDKKLSGEIKEGEQQPTPQPGEKNENAEAALATEPAKPGEMNEAQARALIDSLKGEDEHASLLNSQKENNPTAQPLKDW